MENESPLNSLVTPLLKDLYQLKFLFGERVKRQIATVFVANILIRRASEPIAHGAYRVSYRAVGL